MRADRHFMTTVLANEFPRLAARIYAALRDRLTNALREVLRVAMATAMLEGALANQVASALEVGAELDEGTSSELSALGDRLDDQYLEVLGSLRR